MDHFRVVVRDSQDTIQAVSGEPLNLVDAVAARHYLTAHGFRAFLTVESRPLRLIVQAQQKAFGLAITAPEAGGVSLESLPPLG